MLITIFSHRILKLVVFSMTAGVIHALTDTGGKKDKTAVQNIDSLFTFSYCTIFTFCIKPLQLLNLQLQ